MGGRLVHDSYGSPRQLGRELVHQQAVNEIGQRENLVNVGSDLSSAGHHGTPSHPAKTGFTVCTAQASSLSRNELVVQPMLGTSSLRRPSTHDPAGLSLWVWNVPVGWGKRVALLGRPLVIAPVGFQKVGAGGAGVAATSRNCFQTVGRYGISVQQAEE